MTQGLTITAIGMGLVFIMILLLWLIMAMLVKVTEKFTGIAEEDEGPVAVVTEVAETSASGEEAARLAAAMAAAAYVVRMQKTAKPRSGSHYTKAEDGSNSSNWLSAGRVRQVMARKG